MKVVVRVVVMVAVVGFPFLVSARTPIKSIEKRVNQLETSNQKLKKRIEKMNQRLLAVEDYLESGANPHPPGGGGSELGMACVVTEAAFGRQYTGTADSKLDAEYAAYKACDKDTTSSNCNNGSLKCEAITSYSKSVCVVTDAAFGRRYRGVGDNQILAEADAMKVCDQDTTSSNCKNGTIKCEAMY